MSILLFWWSTRQERRMWFFHKCLYMGSCFSPIILPFFLSPANKGVITHGECVFCCSLWEVVGLLPTCLWLQALLEASSILSFFFNVFYGLYLQVWGVSLLSLLVSPTLFSKFQKKKKMDFRMLIFNIWSIQLCFY